MRVLTYLRRTYLRNARWMLPLLLAMGTAMGDAMHASTCDGKSVESLLARVDRYYGLLRDGNYEAAYNMLAAKYRRSEKDKEEWIEYVRNMAASVTVVGWHVAGGSVIGDTVRLRMEHRLKSEVAPSQWTESHGTEYDFWVRENGDWGFIPMKLDSWDESNASPLILPGTKVNEIEIKPRK